MSLITNIDHLHICAGIEAVAVVAPNQPRAFRGDDAWCPVLDTAIRLFSMTSEQSIRMVVGNYTLLIQSEGPETVAVVLPTGHAIAKSLRRMIRRMSRKNRAPITGAQIAAKQAEQISQRQIPRPVPAGMGNVMMGGGPMGPGGPGPMGPQNMPMPHRNEMPPMGMRGVPMPPNPRMDPNRMDPNRMDPNRMDPNRMDPNRMDPNRMDPNRMDPNRMDQGMRGGPMPPNPRMGMPAPEFRGPSMPSGGPSHPNPAMRPGNPYPQPGMNPPPVPNMGQGPLSHMVPMPPPGMGGPGHQPQGGGPRREDHMNPERRQAEHPDRGELPPNKENNIHY